MKKKFAFKSLLSLAMAGTLFCTTATSSFAEDVGNYELQGPPEYETNPIEALAEEDLSNKVVILSTNDIHGAILQYAYFAALKNYFEEKASGVLLVDSGDFSSDKSQKDNKDIADYKLCGYLSDADHPERSIELMNAAGYDYACLGNHEFDYGAKELKAMLDSAKFEILDANIKTDNNFKYSKYAVTNFEKSPLKIGFFGLDTSEIKRALGNWNKGYTVDDKEELNACAKEQVNALINPTEKDAVPADLVICLSHLGMQKEYAPNSNDQSEVGTTGAGKIGTRSIDLYHNVPGIDLILDAHSHTAIFAGKKDEPIMSGQIWGNYLGITIIDNSTKAIDRYLISDRNYESFFDDDNKTRAEVLEEYGAGPVIDLLEKYTKKDAETLFTYKYEDDSIDDNTSNDTGKNPSNPGKPGRGNDGKHTGRNSGKNNGKYNGKNNSRFGKRGFEYDEEDTEYEEIAEPVEDASVVASTSDESTEFTSEASSNNSSELNEQSTEAASTEGTVETSEQDNAEQSEDTEVEPAA